MNNMGERGVECHNLSGTFIKVIFFQIVRVLVGSSTESEPTCKNHSVCDVDVGDLRFDRVIQSPVYGSHWLTSKSESPAS